MQYVCRMGARELCSEERHAMLLLPPPLPCRWTASGSNLTTTR